MSNNYLSQERGISSVPLLEDVISMLVEDVLDFDSLNPEGSETDRCHRSLREARAYHLSQFPCNPAQDLWITVAKAPWVELVWLRAILFSLIPGLIIFVRITSLYLPVAVPLARGKFQYRTAPMSFY